MSLASCCETVSVADRLREIGLREAPHRVCEVEEPVATARKTPERLEFAAISASWWHDIACGRLMVSLAHAHVEPVAASETAHRGVVLRRVEPSDARAEAVRSLETVREERGGDAATPEPRVDAQRVEPCFAIAEQGQLRHTSDATIGDGDPEPTTPVADPLVEHAGDVVVAPDPRAQRAHRSRVIGPRPAYPYRIGHDLGVCRDGAAGYFALRVSRNATRSSRSCGEMLLEYAGIAPPPPVRIRSTRRSRGTRDAMALRSGPRRPPAPST